MSLHPRLAGAFPHYAILVALAACLLCPFYVQAQRKGKKQQRKTAYGRIKLSTNPSGYPLKVDDQPAGETTAAERLLDLPPGPHMVQVIFPNNKRWTKEFQIVAGRIYCVGLVYQTSTASNPPPGNINSSGQGSVEVIEEGKVEATVADCGEISLPPIPPRRRATSKVKVKQ